MFFKKYSSYWYKFVWFLAYKLSKEMCLENDCSIYSLFFGLADSILNFYLWHNSKSVFRISKSLYIFLSLVNLTLFSKLLISTSHALDFQISRMSASSIEYYCFKFKNIVVSSSKLHSLAVYRYTIKNIPYIMYWFKKISKNRYKVMIKFLKLILSRVNIT